MLASLRLTALPPSARFWAPHPLPFPSRFRALDPLASRTVAPAGLFAARRRPVVRRSRQAARSDVPQIHPRVQPYILAHEPREAAYVLPQQLGDARDVHAQQFGETGHLLAAQLEAAFFRLAGAVAGEVGQLAQEVGEVNGRRRVLPPVLLPALARGPPDLPLDEARSLSSYSRRFSGSERTSYARWTTLKRSSLERSPGFASGWCSRTSFL